MGLRFPVYNMRLCQRETVTLTYTHSIEAGEDKLVFIPILICDGKIGAHASSDNLTLSIIDAITSEEHKFFYSDSMTGAENDCSPLVWVKRIINIFESQSGLQSPSPKTVTVGYKESRFLLGGRQLVAQVPSSNVSLSVKPKPAVHSGAVMTSLPHLIVDGEALHVNIYLASDRNDLAPYTIGDAERKFQTKLSDHFGSMDEVTVQTQKMQLGNTADDTGYVFLAEFQDPESSRTMFTGIAGRNLTFNKDAKAFVIVDFLHFAKDQEYNTKEAQKNAIMFASSLRPGSGTSRFPSENATDPLFDFKNRAPPPPPVNDESKLILRPGSSRRTKLFARKSSQKFHLPAKNATNDRSADVIEVAGAGVRVSRTATPRQSLGSRPSVAPPPVPSAKACSESRKTGLNNTMRTSETSKAGDTDADDESDGEDLMKRFMRVVDHSTDIPSTLSAEQSQLNAMRNESTDTSTSFDEAYDKSDDDTSEDDLLKRYMKVVGQPDEPLFPLQAESVESRYTSTDGSSGESSHKSSDESSDESHDESHDESYSDMENNSINESPGTRLLKEAGPPSEAPPPPPVTYGTPPQMVKHNSLRPKEAIPATPSEESAMQRPIHAPPPPPRRKKSDSDVQESDKSEDEDLMEKFRDLMPEWKRLKHGDALSSPLSAQKETLRLL